MKHPRLIVALLFGLLPIPYRADEAAGSVRVLAIGDTGDPQGSQGVARALDLASAGRTDALVFLGDNFYPKGLNQRHWERAFQAALETPFASTLQRLRGRVHAVTGNHDYYQSTLFWKWPVGFSSVGNGRATSRNEVWSYHYWHTSEALVCSPDAATCAQLLFLDSARAVAMGSCCAADVFDGLQRLLEQRRVEPSVRWRIVFAHHPLETVGEHGNLGRPCGFIRKLRGSVIGGQDTCAPTYREYVQWATRAITASEAKVDLFVAGHDHSLQLLRRAPASTGMPSVHMVSGAGSKESAVKPSSPEDFTSASKPGERSKKGFAEIVADRHQLCIRYFGEANGTEPVPVRLGGATAFTVSPSGELTPGGCKP